jgi:hypothetical protein
MCTRSDGTAGAFVPKTRYFRTKSTVLRCEEIARAIDPGQLYKWQPPKGAK